MFQIYIREFFGIFNLFKKEKNMKKIKKILLYVFSFLLIISASVTAGVLLTQNSAGGGD